jgi:hypothetical protein
VPEYHALQAIGRLGPAATAATPELARRAAAGAPDAALALWQVTGQTEPALRILTEAKAILHLGAMGPAAAPSESTIRENLDSTNDVTRQQAAYALWQVAGDTSTAAPVLTDIARPLASGAYWANRATALKHLADIGQPTPDVTDIARAVLNNPRRLSASGGWRGFVQAEQLRDTAQSLIGQGRG